MTDVAGATAERLESEIAALRAEHEAMDEQLFSIQDAYDVEWAKVPLDQDSPALDKYHGQLLEIFGAQKNLRQRIEVLSSPSELDRRLQDATFTSDGTLKQARTPAEPKASARDRGVPDVYLGETGNFRPGMDARYKSDLILSALGLPAPDALQTYDPADALTRIEERGWQAFLDKKRAKVEGGK